MCSTFWDIWHKVATKPTPSSSLSLEAVPFLTKILTLHTSYRTHSAKGHLRKGRINLIMLVNYNTDWTKIPFLSKLLFTIQRRAFRVKKKKTFKVLILMGSQTLMYLYLYPTYFLLRKTDRNLTSPPRQQAGPTPSSCSEKPRFTRADRFPTPR